MNPASSSRLAYARQARVSPRPGGLAVRTFAASSRRTMVATAAPEATAAAIQVLRSGGNAVDAAVAAAFALSVCEPSGSGLGGQTSLLVRLADGRSIVLDGHSYAPEAVSRKTVRKADQVQGFKACTVPSTAAVLGEALGRYGRLPLPRVLEPAIRLAEEGFPVSRLLRRQIHWCRARLADNELAARRFLPGGSLPRTGDRLLQPELARTLAALSRHGVEEFYHGDLARRIAAGMARHGGLLALEDLRNLRLPRQREAVQAPYRGHVVMTLPPPGGGLQLLLGLRLLESLSGTLPAGDRDAWYEAIARVVHAVFRERADRFQHGQRIEGTLEDWVMSDERLQLLEPGSTPGGTKAGFAEEAGETTHLCVVDEEGLVVSLTQSLQSLFGAKVADDLGFFYNNYLRTCPRRRQPSRLQAGAVPRSNAAPTIVLRPAASGPDEPVMALGGAGSRRIVSSILQVVANCLEHGRALPEAVAAPRIHGMLTGKVMLERPLATPGLLARLGRRFRNTVVKAPLSYSLGAVQAIARGKNGGWVGVSDPRREGAADGD